MVSFHLYLYFCPSQYPVSPSSYLLNLLHQEVLVEVLHTNCGRVEMACVGFQGLLAVLYVYSLSVDAGVMVWVYDVEVTHSLVIGLWGQAMTMIPLEPVWV